MQFWQIWNIQKLRGWFMPKHCSNKTWDYLLITQKQQTLCTQRISFNSGQLQISERTSTKNLRVLWNLDYSQPCDYICNFIAAAIERSCTERYSAKSCFAKGILQWSFYGVVQILNQDLYFPIWLNKLLQT